MTIPDKMTEAGTATRPNTGANTGPDTGVDAEAAAPPHHDPLKGILWMLTGAVFMSAMHTSIRHASADIHPFEIAFFRNVFAFLVVLPWLIRLGWAPLRTKRLGLLVVRGGLNTACMAAFFFALSITPLAEAAALSFTSGIYAALMAIFVFNEKVGLKRWSAIFLGFIGVFVVLRPGFETIGLGQMLILGSALGWGVCMIIIKTLGRTESALTITAYMSLVMAPLSLVPALFVWIWPSWEQLAWMAAIGILGGIGQYAMTEALRRAPTHVVTPIDFTRLLFISLFAYVAFGEVPDIYVWIGGMMIFSGVAFIAYREHVARQARTQPPAV